MLSEGRPSPLCEPYITSLAALRGLEDVPAAGLGERAPDLQGSSFEVQIFPLEALQFAATEPGDNSRDIEGFQPILSHRLEKSPDLVTVQRPYLFSTGTWWLHQRSSVARYQAVVCSLLECLAKSPVDVQDGARSQATIQLLAVESAHVVRCESLELDFPYCRVRCTRTILSYRS